jgi:tetratricopeptide (TPR) repeat protein
MRDDFGATVKRMIAARAGYRCSNPKCRRQTSGPQADPTKAVNIGVAAHITAAASGGPRYDPDLSSEERSSIDNTIWLCQTCAKLIDSDEQRYTTELLWQWKEAAEQAAQRELERRKPLDGYIPHPAPLLIPFQAPRRAPHFQGREPELDALLDHLQPGAAVALCGPGGIGKTALAAEALARLPEDRFPDGIIFHTFYRQPEAALALEHVARSYGHDPRPTPADAARMALASKRALLVLDGAEEADDLGAVLACAGRCGVLITSRRRGDAPDPSLRFDLGPLEEPKAVALLRAWGGARANDEKAAEAICRMVGRLPLAVQLAGAYLDSHDEEAADYLAWLETTPLAALDFGQKQHRSVPVLMERSVERVSEAAQAALELVGLMGFASFGREAIAAGMGIGEGEAGRALGELVDYGLLIRQDGRYAVTHALVHTYARERLPTGEKTRKRLAAHYLALAWGTGDHAVLNAERPHLLAAVSDAHRREDWKTTLGFALALNDWLDLQGHWTDWVAVLKQALDAARGLGGRSVEGDVLGGLGLAYRHLGQVEQAVVYHQKALEIAREIGDRQMEGNALGNLGTAYYSLGQVEQAVEYYQQALEIHREIGDRRNEGSALSNLGLAYRNLGQVDKGIEYHQQALAISREISDRRGEENSLGNLGVAYWHLGQVEQAVEYYIQALEIAREIGDRRGEGNGLGNLGLAYRDLGDTTRARRYLSQALAIFEEIKSPEAERVRRQLAELD